MTTNTHDTTDTLLARLDPGAVPDVLETLPTVDPEIDTEVVWREFRATYNPTEGRFEPTEPPATLDEEAFPDATWELDHPDDDRTFWNYQDACEAALEYGDPEGAL